MNFLFKLAVICAMTGAIIPARVHAQTLIDANLQDDVWTEANGPYIIKNNVVVSGVLSIEPGVQVQFDGPYTLTIGGSLVAKGTPEKNILFTTTSTYPGNWRNIFFDDTSADAVYVNDAYVSGSLLEYVVVEKAGADPDVVQGAIQLSGAHPLIRHSIIRNNAVSGIYADNLQGVFKLIGNTLENNNVAVSNAGGGGLYAGAVEVNTASLVLDANSVRNNKAENGPGGGIRVLNVKTVTITGNIVQNNQAKSQSGGIDLHSVEGVISGNTIAGNRTSDATGKAGGLRAVLSTVAIHDNTIRENQAGEGGGVVIEEGAVNFSRNLVVRNIADTNGGGINVNKGIHNFERNVIALNSAGSATDATGHGGGLDIHSNDGALTTTTVQYNVIGQNSALKYASAVNIGGTGSFINNAVVGNGASTSVFVASDMEVKRNTIAGNITGSGSTIYINAGAHPVILDNNFLQNYSAPDSNLPAIEIQDTNDYSGGGAVLPINATNNWWGTTVEEEIAQRVHPAAQITFAPPAKQIFSNVPPAPPERVDVTPYGDGILVQWIVSPGAITHSKVYWGTKDAPDFENSVEVDVDTSYEYYPWQAFVIPKLPEGTYYIAVTSAYGASEDLPNTPINENQTAGKESWFSKAKSLSVGTGDLSVVMTASPDRVLPGDVITYQIIVTNNAASAAAQVQVYDTLPAGLAFASASPECRQQSQSDITCSLSTLAANQSATFEIRATVQPGAPALISNTVTAQANQLDSTPLNNEATVDVKPKMADLVVMVTALGDAVDGAGKERYTLTLQNAGSLKASGVQLVLTSTAGILGNPDPQNCTKTDNVLTCNFGDIDVGVQRQWEVNAATDGASSIEWSASATALEPDGDTLNNTVSVETLATGGTTVQPGPGKKGGGGGGGGGGIVDLSLLWMLILLQVARVRRVARRH